MTLKTVKDKKAAPSGAAFFIQKNWSQQNQNFTPKTIQAIKMMETIMEF